MAEALQFVRPIDLDSWFKGSKNEGRECDNERLRKTPAFTSRAKKRTSSRVDARRRTLLLAAAALAEREDLGKHSDSLAEFMGVSREELYSMPLYEFIDRYDSALFTEEINAAYDEELEQEDEEFLAHVKGYQGRVLDNED